MDVITNTQNITTDSNSSEDFIAATPVKCKKPNGRKKLVLMEMPSGSIDQVASSSVMSGRTTKGILDEKCDLEDMFCVQERYVQCNIQYVQCQKELGLFHITTIAILYPA